MLGNLLNTTLAYLLGFADIFVGFAIATMELMLGFLHAIVHIVG